MVVRTTPFLLYNDDMRQSPKSRRIRPYIEAALLVAIALVLSGFTLFKAPMGGSITLGSTIPICIVGLRWGVGIGLLAGVNFGLLSFLTSGLFLGPGPFFMDYIFAYACLGLSGLFKLYPFLGVIIAQICRFVFHVISGMIFFSAGKSFESALIFSVQYNAFFLIPDVLIGLCLFGFLVRGKSKKIIERFDAKGNG